MSEHLTPIPKEVSTRLLERGIKLVDLRKHPAQAEAMAQELTRRKAIEREWKQAA